MARVVIAAGGTAGHVVPAIAVADALRAEGAEVSFLGTRERAEADLVPAAGYEIDYLRVSGLDRRNPLKALRAAWRAGRAVGAARRVLERRRADVVLGGGGYVAGPVGLAAVRMGLPLVLTEADSHLGLANRLLARRARRICLSFPIPGRDGDPYVLTGRPVPRAVLEADPTVARRRFGIPGPADCVTVIGGSLGALSINVAAFDAFTRLERGVHDHVGQPWIIHVAGRRDYPELRRRWDEEGRPERYTLIQYEPDLGDVLAAADLVVGRAGGSVMEIAAAGRPAILIPYPHATADHQTTNARWMADGGAAVVIPDGELTPERLSGEIAALLADEDRLREMGIAARRLAKPNAAERIAREVLEVAGRG
ncbi:MAG TPA: undecaprenyldiphospho-muramoylpentapeptide beta-N-acetylglucosaminyltransferase [Solirubrobacterales bacterium]|nr:undecaprenyldiphospho-muramoylpentapeptide beta-N-acetylglucosaminyltransferase [Solirubrobacterales bacterium]